jgi:hypothetical protein
MSEATWRSDPTRFPRGCATVLILKSSPNYQAFMARIRSGTADHRDYRWDDEGELYVAPTWVHK